MSFKGHNNEIKHLHRHLRHYEDNVLQPAPLSEELNFKTAKLFPPQPPTVVSIPSTASVTNVIPKVTQTHSRNLVVTSICSPSNDSRRAIGISLRELKKLREDQKQKCLDRTKKLKDAKETEEKRRAEEKLILKELPSRSQLYALFALFDEFCCFGKRNIDPEKEPQMDSRTLVKLCRDCSLKKMFGTGCAYTTKIDLIFTYVMRRGNRKFIEFDQFVRATELMADHVGTSQKKLIAKMLRSQGPRVRGVIADYVKFHDDKSTFTGVWKHGKGPTIENEQKIDCEDLVDRSSCDIRGVPYSMKPSTDNVKSNSTLNNSTNRQLTEVDIPKESIFEKLTNGNTSVKDLKFPLST